MNTAQANERLVPGSNSHKMREEGIIDSNETG